MRSHQEERDRTKNTPSFCGKLPFVHSSLAWVALHPVQASLVLRCVFPFGPCVNKIHISFHSPKYG